MSTVTVYNQNEFDHEIDNILLGKENIMLNGDKFILNVTLTPKKIIGYSTHNKPKLFLIGRKCPISGENEVIFPGLDIKDVILTSDEKINLIIDNSVDLSSFEVDETKINIINVDLVREEKESQSHGIDVYTQEELDDVIENKLGKVNLHGDIFIIPHTAAGFTFIGMHESTIVILTGENDYSAKMSFYFDDDFDDHNDHMVYQRSALFIRFKNVIISSERKLELVFTDRNAFDEWQDVRYDLENIDVVVREEEFREFDMNNTYHISKDRNFLDKFKVLFTGYE